MDTIQSQMTTPVISINSEATAQEAAQLMKEKEIGSLLVKGSRVLSAYWRSGTWHIDWCVKAWTHGPLLSLQ